MVTVRVCSKLQTSWKSVVFANKVGKNSLIFVGVLNKTIIPLALVGYEKIIANSYPTRTREIIVNHYLGGCLIDWFDDHTVPLLGKCGRWTSWRKTEQIERRMVWVTSASLLRFLRYFRGKPARQELAFSISFQVFFQSIICWKLSNPKPDGQEEHLQGFSVSFIFKQNVSVLN